MLCRELTEDVHNQTIVRVMVGEVVSDDDSTLRSMCFAKKNGGKLGEGVHEPKFLANFNG